MAETPGKKSERDPEVIEKATRCRFTAEYKQRIAREAEQCSQPGEIGALLRREGLYSSMLARWRRQLHQETMTSPSQRRAKRSSNQELEKLKRDNERLKEKLRQAELIIDAQKKVSEMIQTRSHEKDV